MHIIKYFLVMLSIPVLTFAQDLEQVSCSSDGLYRFQSTSISLSPKDETLGKEYKIGETIKFVGYVENTNDYPIVDGYVFARLGYENEDFNTEGSNTIDEFIIVEDISIDGREKEALEFEYTIPANLPSGEYRMDFFFSVDKRFNLGGLPFTNEITNGYVNFGVEGEDVAPVLLEKSETQFNDTQYRHIGSWPRVSSQDSFNITQPIYNNTDEDLSVDITYDLYFWDSLDKNDLIDSTTQTVIVPANSSLDLTYLKGGFEKSVGYLKITAEVDGFKTLVNLRFITDLNDTKLNYSAITGFPLLKGEDFSVFGCAYNTNGFEDDLKVSITLRDKKGNVIIDGDSISSFGTRVEGFVASSTSNRNYDYLSLYTEIKDASGNVLDSYSTEYDCEALMSESCVDLLSKSYDQVIIYLSVGILILIVVGIVVYVRFRKRGEVIDSTVVGTLVALMIVSGTLLASNISRSSEIVFAQSYISGTQQTGSEVSRNSGSSKYFVGYQSQGIFIGSGVNALVDSIIVTRNMKGRLLSNISGVNLSDLSIGDIFFVELESECTWNGEGGVWDTPNCGIEYESIDYSDDGELEYALVNVLPMETITSLNYDSNILNCSLNSSNTSGHVTTDIHECVVVGLGSTNLTATINDAPSEVKACGKSERLEKFLVTSNNSNNSDPDCGNESWSISSSLPLKLYYGYKPYGNTGYSVSSTYNDNEIDMDGDTYTWSITSTGSIDGICGTADGTQVESQPSGGELCSQGSSANLTEGVGGSYTWNCNGINGGDDVSCSTLVVPDFTIDCDVNDRTIESPAEVVWTVTVTGDGSYTYSWSETGGTEIDNTFAKTYTDSGTYQNTVTVTDDVGAEVSDLCPSVWVYQPLEEVDGVCGSSDGDSFSTTPTSNLCGPGTSINMTFDYDTDEWTWTCQGYNGGANDSCAASYNGGFGVTLTPGPSGDPTLDGSDKGLADSSGQCLISWEVLGETGVYSCLIKSSDGSTVSSGIVSDEGDVDQGDTYIVECTDEVTSAESNEFECLINPNFQEI